MRVLHNISELLTLKKAFEKDGRKLRPEDLSLISNASLVFDSNQIHWVGSSKDLPIQYEKAAKIDCSQMVVTPELVDSHTHLVFGGDRSQEYSMRLNGADYTQIAQMGGGILSTMNSTQNLSESELIELGKKRIERMYSLGVGTIEIKSGYGLSRESEITLSRVIDKLKKIFAPKIQIFRTYMAAHAVPKHFSHSKEYLDKIVLPVLDQLAEEKLIDAVDIFHEEGYFNTEDVERLFQFAQNRNLYLKSHADEFNDNQGAALAAKYQALSCDHLLATSKDGIKKLATSSTVATLLPGTGFFLGKNQVKAREFLDAGVKVAIATDYNPGSCHYDQLLQLAAMSAPTYKMNMTELWAAMTLNAAHALGYNDQGSLIEGHKPRFSFFETDSLAKITYHWGENLVRTGILDEY